MHGPAWPRARVGEVRVLKGLPKAEEVAERGCAELQMLLKASKGAARCHSVGVAERLGQDVQQLLLDTFKGRHPAKMLRFNGFVSHVARLQLDSLQEKPPGCRDAWAQS